MMSSLGATLRREIRDESSVQSALESRRSTGLVDLSTMAAPNDSGQTRVAYSRSKGVFWWSSWCTCATASYQNKTHSFLCDHRCETLAQREHKWSTVSHRAWLGTVTTRVAVGWGAHLSCQRRDRCSAHSQRTALRPEPAAELSALHARDPAHSTREHRSAAGGVRSAASRRARSRTAACLCSIAVVRCRKSVHAARATSHTHHALHRRTILKF